ncbi:acetyl-CoA carboxylase carboxyl transferase subunit alpha/beta, partial [Aduncisulcus paluster]
MLSHGYYSVISPEGAAAIEANLKGGKRVDNALIGNCARKLGITAEDNLKMGYIDRVVQEPHLGAKPAICISVKGLKLFRAMALKQKGPEEGEDVFMRWALSSRARARLVEKRYEKFRNLSTSAYMDQRSLFLKMGAAVQGVAWSTKSLFVYNLVGRTVRAAKQGMEEIQA